MLNVGQLNEGVVLDHIEAGKSMSIYHYLKLDQLDCCVAIIKNGEIVDKKKLHLPKQIVNVIKCKNPRCITSIEHGLDQVFVLSNEEKEIYRCRYCDERYHASKAKHK